MASGLTSNFNETCTRIQKGDWSHVDVHCRDSKRNTPLYGAISDPRLRGTIDRLVALGADVNARNRCQTTSLHIAVQKGDIESIECLLKNGADINTTYKIGISSMSEAVRLNKVQAVKVLAQLGLARSVEHVQLGHPLHLLTNHANVLKYIVQKGANMKGTKNIVPILNAAIESGNIEIVRILLDHGAEVNSITESNMSIVMTSLLKGITDSAWFTLLKNLGADFNLPYTQSSSIHEAVTSGRLDMIELLIKHKADTSDGMFTETPIDLALEMKQYELLSHLIKCGADINARYEPQCYPLFTACRNRNIEMVKALWTKQSVDNTSREGITVLFNELLTLLGDRTDSCTKLENVKAVKKLISLGANVNDRFDVRRVLEEAVAHGDVNMVEELVKLGADVNDRAESKYSHLIVYLDSITEVGCKTNNQIMTDVLETLLKAGANPNEEYDLVTPLFMAVERSDTEMVKTLARIGADMNKTIVKHVTHIHFAVMTNNIEIMEILIKHNANPNAEYLFGVTPLLAALDSKNTDMVQCLLKCGAKALVGDKITKIAALSAALTTCDYDAMKYLVSKSGGGVTADILTGYIPFDDEIAKMAEDFEIKIADISIKTFLSRSMANGHINREGIEALLFLQASQSSRRNVFNDASGNHRGVQSYLAEFCERGDLDIVRLMIIDGSDVNKLDSHGRPPLAYLPLASIIDYQALHETKTKNVIEKVRIDDFTPSNKIVKTMESLLDKPGIGDVHNIKEINVTEIYKDVEKAILNLVEKIEIFPETAISIKSCGSAAEGTKVGLPDEMDFLAVIGSTDQHHLQYAGHDYAHLKNFPGIFPEEESSHEVHQQFLIQFEKSIELTALPESLEASIQMEGRSCFTRRKATTPLLLKWRKNIEHSATMEFCKINISVDAVPSIHVKNWPENARKKTWLLNLDELKSQGYFIVSKPPHSKSVLAKEYTDKNPQDLWKMSFPHLETYHMQHLDKRIKDVYLLAKCIRNPDVCRIMVTDNGSYPRNTEKYVTSYMLKMIFFKNVEYFLSSNLSLGEMVCQVYDELVESLTQGFIPLYFMPEVCAVSGHNVDMAKSARAAKILKKFAHSFNSNDCQGATGDSADTTSPSQLQSVYQSIEIGLGDI